jgi:hypothetical protein
MSSGRRESAWVNNEKKRQGSAAVLETKTGTLTPTTCTG